MEGPERLRAFRELFIAPSNWQLEVEPIATRGARLSLYPLNEARHRDADRPFTEELFTVLEIEDGDRCMTPSASTSTTSTPPSRSSMRDTSQAKPPTTRTHGRSSRVPMPRSTGANSPRRHRTG